MQPSSCPPSNEGWPKEESIKTWPKEEPVDVDMDQTTVPTMPTVTMPDPSLQPPPLPDALFASPETWISSLPSECALSLILDSSLALGRLADVIKSLLSRQTEV